MEKGFSLQGLARHVSDVVGGDVSTGWVSTVMHHILDGNAVDGRYSGIFRFTGEHAALLSAYAVQWFHKKNAPTIKEWMNQHGHTVPKPYELPEKVVKPKAQQPFKYDDAAMRRIVERETKRHIEPLIKEIQSLRASSAPAITDNRSPREAELEELNKAVKNFAITSDKIGIAGAWRWLERLFERRNGIRVLKVGKQTFPQWLRSSGYLDKMMEQLQGYLDYMHDTLEHRPVPNFDRDDSAEQRMLDYEN